MTYVTQPFRGLPGDTGAFRGTGEPLGGDLGAYVNWRRATPVCCHMQASLKTRGRGSNFSFASLLHMLATILIHRLGPQKVRPSWLCSKVIRQGSKQSHVTWNGWFTGCIGAIGLKICSHKYTAAKKNTKACFPHFPGERRQASPRVYNTINSHTSTQSHALPCALQQKTA